MIRLWGAILVLAATCSAGFHMAAGVSRQLAILRQFCVALEVMQCEIQWNQVKLPQLCQLLSKHCTGAVAQMFADLSQILQHGTDEPVEKIFNSVMQQHKIPADAMEIWQNLAQTFGRYDPERQAMAVHGAQERMRILCQRTETERKFTCRKFQLFGICSGAALVILLL